MRYYEVMYDGESTLVKARSHEDAIAKYTEDHIWINREAGITASEPRARKTDSRDNIKAMIEGKKRKAEERKRAE